MKLSLIISVSFHHTYWTTINCDYRSEVEFEATFSIFLSFDFFFPPQQQRNFIGWNAISSERSGANSIDSQYKYCKKRTNEHRRRWCWNIKIGSSEISFFSRFALKDDDCRIVILSFLFDKRARSCHSALWVNAMTTLSSLKCIVWMLQQLVSFTQRGKNCVTRNFGIAVGCDSHCYTLKFSNMKKFSPKNSRQRTTKCQFRPRDPWKIKSDSISCR